MVLHIHKCLFSKAATPASHAGNTGGAQAFGLADLRCESRTGYHNYVNLLFIVVYNL